MKDLEARLASGHRLSAPVVPQAGGVRERPAAYAPTPRVSTRSGDSAAGTGSGHDDVWGRILVVLKSKKPSLASFLEHSRIAELSDKDLVIEVKGGFQAEQAEKPESRSLVEQAAEEILNRKVRVKVQLAAAILSASAKAETKTKDPKKTKPQDQDPIAQDVLKVFNGQFIETDNDE